MLNRYRSNEIGRIPTYRQIYDVMLNDPLLQRISLDAIDRYWQTFAGDALTGNFDRHKGNWGYLVNEDARTIRLAPVYDCGSCLYPNLGEDGMKQVMQSKDEIEKRLFVFSKAALNLSDNIHKEQKAGYYEYLASGLDENCTKALMEISRKIDLNAINRIIEATPFLSDTRIEFYELMVRQRYERIIIPAKEHLLQKEQSRCIITDRNGQEKISLEQFAKAVAMTTPQNENQYPAQDHGSR